MEVRCNTVFSLMTAFVVVAWLPVYHWCTTEDPMRLDVFKRMMNEVGLDQYFPTIEKSVMKKMAMAKVKDYDLLDKMRFVNSEVKKISELMNKDATLMTGKIDKLVRKILQFLRPEMNRISFSNETLRDVYGMTDENIREYNRLCQESRDIFFKIDFKFNKEIQ